MSHALISAAFEDLSHSLRVLLEADIRANRYGLIQVDRAEAVGNIEIGYTSVLNAFHSLYDSVGKELNDSPISWYDTQELATILALRNARHHNKANKIRTLYTYHVQNSENPGKLSQYVLVDFPAVENGADTFDLFISWFDLDAFLSMPKKENMLRIETVDSIRDYLKSHMFLEYCEFYGQNINKLFLNSIPLIVNAASKIVPKIHEFVKVQSFETETYLEFFSNMKPADTQNPEVDCGPFALFN